MKMRAILLVALLITGVPTGCGVSQTKISGTAPNASTPGWTGRTVVIGSNSTVAGNAEATEQQQKWQLGPTR